MLCGRRFRRKQERTGAVIDPGGVAGGHAERGAVDALQLGQAFNAGVRPRMLVGIDHFELTLLLRHLDEHDLVLENTSLLGCGPALLGTKRESVLVLTADIKIGRYVIRRLRHGMRAELLVQPGVHEAPPDGGVEDFRLTAEGALRLAHHKRRARHALDAAGDHELGLA